MCRSVRPNKLRFRTHFVVMVSSKPSKIDIKNVELLCVCVAYNLHLAYQKIIFWNRSKITMTRQTGFLNVDICNGINSQSGCKLLWQRLGNFITILKSILYWPWICIHKPYSYQQIYFQPISTYIWSLWWHKLALMK